MNDYDKCLTSCKSKYLIDLFDYLNDGGISYCVLGQTKDLPDAIPNDIDIVVTSSVLSVIHFLIVKFTKERGCQLVQKLNHEQTACCYVISFQDKEKVFDVLNIDICSHFYINGNYYLSSKSLLDEKMLATDIYNCTKNFFIASPKQELIYYLIKKIVKRDLSLQEFNHLKEQYFKDTKGGQQQLLHYFTRDDVLLIIDAFKENNYKSLQRSIFSLKVVASRSAFNYALDFLRELKRKVHRVITPTGLIIVFLGPDGVGKTTIGDGIKTGIMPAFRKLECFHLRPYSLNKKKKNAEKEQNIDVTDPHGKPSRSKIVSVIKLFYFLADYCWGFLSRIRPLKVRSTLIVFDRYYDDLIIDPKRYRYGAPLLFAKVISRFIPKPDLYIVLDAPTEVIQSRKKEVSFEETDRQRQSYLKFHQKNRNCILLETTQTLEETINNGCREILSFMNSRVSK